MIEKANAFAQEAHRGQKRASGEPYVFHALATAEILTDLKVDSKSIAAGLLHDVLDEHEDAELENLRKQLEKEFGKETTNLVWGVTKSGKIKYRGVERAVENLRKMFLAIAQDIRVVIIKLADRLHNMRTLAALPPEKQLRIARETMDIYAPLADRLGIGRVKGELEDLAFKYLMPGEYQWLTQQVRDKLDEREKYLSKIVPELTEELQKEGVKPLNVYWRAKHYYSLYKKLVEFYKIIERHKHLLSWQKTPR